MLFDDSAGIASLKEDDRAQFWQVDLLGKADR